MVYGNGRPQLNFLIGHLIGDMTEHLSSIRYTDSNLNGVLEYSITPHLNIIFLLLIFLTGIHTVDELARAWLYNYERPADPSSSESIRVQRSERWYTFLTGQEPEPPGPEPPGPKPKEGGNGMPIYMYPAFRKR